MIRKEAMKILVEQIKNQPIISANGFMSRDLFELSDNPSNFYMIGSMGLASSIGLGVSLKKPMTQVFIFDGDGNILMNLGSLTTIGFLQPKNLIHVIFDNSSHESTGGQPTSTTKFQIEKFAKVANYQHVFRIKNKNTLLSTINKIKKLSGPIMILIKVEQSKERSSRVLHKTTKIRDTFMNFLDDIQ